MKSFKLISMQIVNEDVLTEIEFDEGLIINKEDDSGSWMLEVFVEDSYVPYFIKDKKINVQVIITNEENDPAPFRCKVSSINQVNGHASILLEGNLIKVNQDYPAALLEHLLSQGLTGDHLLAEFREKLTERPKIIIPPKS